MSSFFAPMRWLGRHQPKLSLVVISYNMVRELRRTLQSLSPAMQKDVDPKDYEVIVVDNGSTEQIDNEKSSADIHCLRFVSVSNPTVSPVPAINLGLEMARGELIGVMIDGARMASPGLVRMAIEARHLHPRPVIGTLSYHLGPDVQMRSVAKGYNQQVEDALLVKTNWEEDGYRLFDISVPAASSSGGWFSVPAETNALFLTARHWRELGGYDARFVSPGGGLANLDIWRRVCEDKRNMVILLLGEATFHQVHGGIATNSIKSRWSEFHDEYSRIHKKEYVRPDVNPRIFGKLRESFDYTL
jgi:glycosyltransferase involved in cell wall biosynthesis